MLLHTTQLSVRSRTTFVLSYRFPSSQLGRGGGCDCKAVVKNNEILSLPGSLCQICTGGKVYKAKVVTSGMFQLLLHVTRWSGITVPNAMNSVFVGTKQEMESLGKK